MARLCKIKHRSPVGSNQPGELPVASQTRGSQIAISGKQSRSRTATPITAPKGQNLIHRHLLPQLLPPLPTEDGPEKARCGPLVNHAGPPSRQRACRQRPRAASPQSEAPLKLSRFCCNLLAPCLPASRCDQENGGTASSNKLPVPTWLVFVYFHVAFHKNVYSAYCIPGTVWRLAHSC